MPLYVFCSNSLEIFDFFVFLGFFLFALFCWGLGFFFLVFHYLTEHYEESKEILAVLIRLLLHLQRHSGCIFSHRKHKVINLQKITKGLSYLSWQLVPRFNDDGANFSPINYFMETSSNVSVIGSILRGQSAKLNFGAIKDQIMLQLKILYFSREPERVKQGEARFVDLRGEIKIF